MTTFVVTFPRMILPEVNTHRMVSKNSASSRARPFAKMLADALNNPFVPSVVYKNQSGMQGSERLDPRELLGFQERVRELRDYTATWCQETMDAYNVHKQTINRYLEPWAWCTQVTSATDWDNFFGLRTHKDAQPEFQEIAKEMYRQYQESVPELLVRGEWHLPFTDLDTWNEAEDYCNKNKLASISGYPQYHELLDVVKKISAGRCARVSYLTHDNKRDVAEDIKLYDRLASADPKHMSPLEHIATPYWFKWQRSGNLNGWQQFRKTIKYENIKEFSGW